MLKYDDKALIFSILEKYISHIFLMEKTNACLKNNELTAVLGTHFKGKMNLARVKLISLFVCSLCKVQTVTFDKLDLQQKSGQLDKSHAATF